MNSKMKEAPANSLIINYQPADYMDSFSRIIVCEKAITPKEFCHFAFSRFPKWIERLMNLRNVIVKPLRLNTGDKFTDKICASSPNEEILGMQDKHLDFHVSMWCGEHKDGKQELRMTTVVKYNNWFGRVYFFVVRLFHMIIVKSILNNIDKRVSRSVDKIK